MNAFFRSPSLGGWIAFANMGFWVAVFAFVMNWRKPYPAMLLTSWCAGIEVAMSMPFLIFFFPGCGGILTQGGVFVLVAVLVVNAFVWGYGLAFGIKQLRRLTF